MATCPKCLERYDDGQEICPADGERLLPDEACRSFDDDLAPGTLVGEYRVEGKIGEGGFGRVFRAVHPVIGKQAAIKVLNREYSSNPDVVSRFVSEARAVNQIRHRNIIDIFSFGSLDDGRQYLVMEFLEGMTFDAYLREHGRMSPAEAVPLFRALARALDAAHSAGIAHRDLKPENVFLVADDDGGVFPKLLDFGIAKLMGDAAAGHKTRTGAAMGTPLYMSPEQCRGLGVDHRTDIYSFGIMVHEALTGRLPFDGESMMDLMFKHAEQPPPPLSSVCPDIPEAMDAPVLEMLAKAPGDRPKSLVEAVDALADAARGVGYAIPSPNKSTTGEAIKLSRSGLGSSATVSAPTVADTSAAGESAQARTLNTVESDVRPGGGGSKTLVVAAAALVIGVGATLALTRGGGDADPSPADSATAEPTTAPTGDEAAPFQEPDGASSAQVEASVAPAPEPTASAPATPSASATVSPRAKLQTARPPAPKVTPPPTSSKPPPPTAKPPPPVVPDELANPFE